MGISKQALVEKFYSDNLGLYLFFESYIETLFFTSRVDGDGEDPGMDFDGMSWGDMIAPALLESLNDCKGFLDMAWEVLERACMETGNDLAMAGHDFALTRNGHGAGFWDGDWSEWGDELTNIAKSFGSADIYLHHGKVYLY